MSERERLGEKRHKRGEREEVKNKLLGLGFGDIGLGGLGLAIYRVRLEPKNCKLNRELSVCFF